MAAELVTDELVESAARGDAAALTEIFRALSPAIRGYLRGKGVADPDTSTSDVFVALFGRIETVQGGAIGLRKLAFTIAHARMVDEHRAQARRPTPVRWVAEIDARTEASAEDVVVAKEGTAWVMAILDQLPSDQREVLVMRIVGDLTIDQVAEVIGRSPGAVKQLQRRGMKKVRDLVSESGVTL